MLTTLLTLANLLSASARPEINSGVTAEGLAHESTLVALATPIDVRSARAENGVWYTSARFLLDEVLKGPESAGDAVTIRTFDYETADELGLEQAAEEGRQLLVFCALSRGHGPEMEGKFAFTEHHRFESACFVGAPVEELYTPRFELLGEYRELLARTRNQIAREDWFVQQLRGIEVVTEQVEIPSGTKAHSKLFGGSKCYLLLPVYRSAAGVYLNSEERLGRSPASFTLDPGRSSIERLFNCQRSFGNRRYIWNDVPERFRGWSYRRTLGGEHESMQLDLDVGGHVYVAVESRAIVEMKEHGWTPEGLDGDSTFTYTDRRRSLMVVFSKEFHTGARCDVPQLAWTGTLVLLPPRDLR